VWRESEVKEPRRLQTGLKKDGRNGSSGRAQGELKESKVKVPTRQTRVWGTQIRFRINRSNQAPTSKVMNVVDAATLFVRLYRLLYSSSAFPVVRPNSFDCTKRLGKLFRMPHFPSAYVQRLQFSEDCLFDQMSYHVWMGGCDTNKSWFFEPQRTMKISSR
jgi:hypothetical protein